MQPELENSQDRDGELEELALLVNNKAAVDERPADITVGIGPSEIVIDEASGSEIEVYEVTLFRDVNGPRIKVVL